MPLFHAIRRDLAKRLLPDPETAAQLEDLDQEAWDAIFDAFESRVLSVADARDVVIDLIESNAFPTEFPGSHGFTNWIELVRTVGVEMVLDEFLALIAATGNHEPTSRRLPNYDPRFAIW